LTANVAYCGFAAFERTAVLRSGHLLGGRNTPLWHYDHKVVSWKLVEGNRHNLRNTPWTFLHEGIRYFTFETEMMTLLLVGAQDLADSVPQFALSLKSVHVSNQIEALRKYGSRCAEIRLFLLRCCAPTIE